jgi:thiol-disulfide isomerase/thioredoxin
MAEADDSIDLAQRRVRARRAALRALAALGILAVSPSARALAKGDIAPACVASTPDGSRTVSVAHYKGKVVYLDFWASWCPPCRESFPFMNELQRELGDHGLQIIAVSVDKSPEDARRFMERFPPQFTVVLDPTWVCASAYLLPGMPTSFIIDRAGLIRAVQIGFRGSDKAGIRAALEEALRDEPK